MKIAKLIRRRLRSGTTGVKVAGDVNAAAAANVGERGQVTSVTSKQSAAASTGEASDDR